MSYQVDLRVTIAGRMYRVDEVEITSTWMETAKIARFELPRRLRVLTTSGYTTIDTNTVVREGDAVKIETGYVPKTYTAFEGYVYRSYPGEIMQIECWDAWCLTQFKVKFSAASVSLRGLIDVIKRQAGSAWNFKGEVLHVNGNIGQLTIDRSQGLKVFDTLRGSYGLDSFVRNGVFHIGAAYVASLQKRHNIDFSRHVYEEDGLRFVQRPLPTLVRATGITDGQSFTVQVGTAGGQEIPIYRYGVETESLKAAAQAELNRRLAPGYEGTIGLLGWPYVQHGDILQLNDPANPSTRGGYAVKRVRMRISTADAITQDCELDGVRIIS